MIVIRAYRAASTVPRIRTDDDCDWQWEPTGELDDDGEDVGDYVPCGSFDPSPWEAMCMALARG